VCVFLAGALCAKRTAHAAKVEQFARFHQERLTTPTPQLQNTKRLFVGIKPAAARSNVRMGVIHHEKHTCHQGTDNRPNQQHTEHEPSSPAAFEPVRMHILMAGRQVLFNPINVGRSQNRDPSQ
jgi:hypothetical protein